MNTSSTGNPNRNLPTLLPSQVVYYWPTSEIVAATWRCPMQVLGHLLCHPEERSDLLSQAQQQSLNQPQDMFVYHPLLQYTLCFHSSDEDVGFLYKIQTLAVEQSAFCQAIHRNRCLIPHPVFSPSSGIYIPQYTTINYSSAIITARLLRHFIPPIHLPSYR
jgi:hypothetical protein